MPDPTAVSCNAGSLKGLCAAITIAALPPGDKSLTRVWHGEIPMYL
jgi:hypothetical protein